MIGQLHLAVGPQAVYTHCELLVLNVSCAEDSAKATCPICWGAALAPDAYRRVDFRVGGLTGAYITVYQRVDEAPLLDLAFFDGDRSLEETRLRIQALTRAHKLASIWGAQTARSVGSEDARTA